MYRLVHRQIPKGELIKIRKLKLDRENVDFGIFPTTKNKRSPQGEKINLGKKKRDSDNKTIEKQRNTTPGCDIFYWQYTKNFE